ncbi:hypothetical protein GCM10009798_32910 [Nocardioides panacihumi]|uniref:Uncharacterized protein n=1 Tax=Nocardioides panacihumi TaxID=400774 RepID=A0ABP5CY60_9ACTN
MSMQPIPKSSAEPAAGPRNDSRAGGHAVVLGFLAVFALLTWSMPFGGTFAVALIASFTLSQAPRWWRALVGCLALTGFLFGLAYTAYLFVSH